MTLSMWLEFVAIIVLVIAMSYAGARFDIYSMQRQARKQHEQQRLIDTLKR
jgi:phage portal protein BeeE